MRHRHYTIYLITKVTHPRTNENKLERLKLSYVERGPIVHYTNFIGHPDGSDKIVCSYNVEKCIPSAK